MNFLGSYLINLEKQLLRMSHNQFYKSCLQTKILQLYKQEFNTTCFLIDSSKWTWRSSIPTRSAKNHYDILILKVNGNWEMTVDDVSFYFQNMIDLQFLIIWNLISDFKIMFTGSLWQRICLKKFLSYLLYLEWMTPNLHIVNTQ